jgi:hypothetical protein
MIVFLSVAGPVRRKATVGTWGAPWIEGRRVSPEFAEKAAAVTTKGLLRRSRPRERRAELQHWILAAFRFFDALSLPARLPARVRAMNGSMTALERAFDLARSGGCASLAEILKRLRHEGYASHQIEGPHLRKQLARLIEKAKALTPTGPGGFP